MYTVDTGYYAVLDSGWILMWDDNMDFFTGGSLIMDYGLVLWPEMTVYLLK